MERNIKTNTYRSMKEIIFVAIYFRKGDVRKDIGKAIDK